jgi:iron(III) transport system substrate-binding protein
MSRIFSSVAVAAVFALTLSGCAAQEPAPTSSEAAAEAQSLVLYSGRAEDLVQPIIDQFTEETGIEVEVRYAGTAELAAQLLEEGESSPADAYLAQDAGALGAIAKAGLFQPIPAELFALVNPAFSGADNLWVGLSGRVRVLNYNPEKVTDLPKSVLELAEPQWQGRIGIAPANASFQAFVTAMRITEGEDATAAWLEGIKRNGVVFEKNSGILEAVETGQVDAGLINHYYWFARGAEVGAENMTSKLAGFEPNDVGNLINVAGLGILKDNAATRALTQFLLSETAQRYFVEQTFEYPVIKGLDAVEGLSPMDDLPAPDIDLSDLDTLEQTLELIRAAGLI